MRQAVIYCLFLLCVFTSFYFQLSKLVRSFGVGSIMIAEGLQMLRKGIIFI